MADEDYDYENESEGIKQVRAALKAKEKENKELLEKLAGFESKVRTASLSDLLKAKGADKFAKFFPSDIEVDEAHVNTWVEENAELFGIKAPEANADPNQIEAAKQLANASGGEAPLPTDFEGLRAQIKNTKSDDELKQVLAQLSTSQFGNE